MPIFARNYILLVISFSMSYGAFAAILPVQTQTIQQQEFYQVSRRYAGKVSSRRNSQLTCAVSGIVKSVMVAEGERVDAGQLLLSLDNRHLQAQRQQAVAQVASASAQLAVDTANKALAALSLTRFQQLRDTGHASQAQFDEVYFKLSAKGAAVQLAEANLLAAKAALASIDVDLNRANIYAPFAGQIQRRVVDEGAALGPGQWAFELLETQYQQARFALPTKLYKQLQTGSVYTVTVADQEVTAQLIRVLPGLDAGAANMQVKLQFVDAPTFLNGAVAQLHWQQNIASSGFWLPMSALSEAQRGLWSVLAVVKENKQQQIQRRLVDVVHTEADRVFVSGTLTSGDQIVVAGSQNLIPGQQVTSVNTVVAR